MLVYGSTSMVAVQSKSGICATVDSVGIKRTMSTLSRAMKELEWPMQKCEPKTFILKTRKLVEL